MRIVFDEKLPRTKIPQPWIADLLSRAPPPSSLSARYSAFSRARAFLHRIRLRFSRHCCLSFHLLLPYLVRAPTLLMSCCTKCNALPVRLSVYVADSSPTHHFILVLLLPLLLLSKLFSKFFLIFLRSWSAFLYFTLPVLIDSSVCAKN